VSSNSSDPFPGTQGKHMPRDRQNQRIVQAAAVITKRHISVIEDVMNSFEELFLCISVIEDVMESFEEMVQRNK
jgi:hypothetical protein